MAGTRPRVWRTVPVRWWLRLPGWSLAAGAIAAVADWRWAPLGIVAFEALRALVALRRSPSAYAGGDPGPQGGGAGVREPRRPLPTGGSGAAALRRER